MKEPFWHKCWEKDHIGFHQDDFHPLLVKHFGLWALESRQKIFVPLCGKSFDMHYLAQSHQILGSELSEIACKDFFNEAKLSCHIVKQSRYTRYTGVDIELLAGDFFVLEPKDVEQYPLIYDRAALIALPKAMRKRYVDKLRSLYPTGARLFLLTLEYPVAELEGPPFTVDENEVRELFNGSIVERVETLACIDGQFARRKFNVSTMQEVLYFIQW